MSLAAAPVEVLSLILSKVDCRTLSVCARVCRRWRATANKLIRLDAQPSRQIPYRPLTDRPFQPHEKRYLFEIDAFVCTLDVYLPLFQCTHVSSLRLASPFLEARSASKEVRRCLERAPLRPGKDYDTSDHQKALRRAEAHTIQIIISRCNAFLTSITIWGVNGGQDVINSIAKCSNLVTLKLWLCELGVLNYRPLVGCTLLEDVILQPLIHLGGTRKMTKMFPLSEFAQSWRNLRRLGINRGVEPETISSFLAGASSTLNAIAVATVASPTCLASRSLESITLIDCSLDSTFLFTFQQIHHDLKGMGFHQCTAPEPKDLARFLVEMDLEHLAVETGDLLVKVSSLIHEIGRLPSLREVGLGAPSSSWAEMKKALLDLVVVAPNLARIHMDQPESPEWPQELLEEIRAFPVEIALLRTPEITAPFV